MSINLGHTQPAVAVSRAIFPWLLSLCKISKILIVSEMMLNKESCNIIVWEHILFWLEIMCIKLMKKRFGFLRNFQIFCSQLFT